MVVIEEPKSTLPAQLKGFHLFHDDVATCCQRVRWVLAEKGVRRRPRDVQWRSTKPGSLDSSAGGDGPGYVSRIVSLKKSEHLTEEYAELHPNMVVPTLVHDGKVLIESVDIVHYLDTLFPAPRIFPAEGTPERAEHDRLVELAKELHYSIRYVMFRYVLGGLGKAKKEAVEALKQFGGGDKNPEGLGEFHEKFRNGDIASEVFVKHLGKLEGGLDTIEEILREKRFLLGGDAPTFADMMWTLKVLNIRQSDYPLRRNFPAVHRWYTEMCARPTFREEVWRHLRVWHNAMRMKGKLVNALGGGIAAHARKGPAVRSASSPGAKD